MKENAFLVVVDGSREMPVALRYAAQRAQACGVQVALLYVVEPVAIETWGGVERAVMDEAFAEARKEMAVYEKLIEETTGQKPLTFYRKGERRKVLMELLENEPSLTTIVLAAQTKEGSGNPLIQYLTSDKGLRKLKVPLIIVPDTYDAPEAKDA